MLEYALQQGVVCFRPNPQADGLPLAGCPWLLILSIRIHAWRPFPPSKSLYMVGFCECANEPPHYSVHKSLLLDPIFHVILHFKTILYWNKSLWYRITNTLNWLESVYNAPVFRSGAPSLSALPRSLGRSLTQSHLFPPPNAHALPHPSRRNPCWACRLFWREGHMTLLPLPATDSAGRREGRGDEKRYQAATRSTATASVPVCALTPLSAANMRQYWYLQQVLRITVHKTFRMNIDSWCLVLHLVVWSWRATVPYSSIELGWGRQSSEWNSLIMVLVGSRRTSRTGSADMFGETSRLDVEWDVWCVWWTGCSALGPLVLAIIFVKERQGALSSPCT